MVELLLADSTLAAETGTAPFGVNDVSLVQDSTVCTELNAVAPPHSDPDYYRTYFVAGEGEATRYFVVYSIPGVEDPDPTDDELPIRYAMEIIGVFDSSFTLIEGYQW